MNSPCCVLQYLASLGIQSLVQQGAKQGMPANKLLDALRGTDIMHWKQSLSELIEISLAQTTSIWRMYGKRSDDTDSGYLQSLNQGCQIQFLEGHSPVEFSSNPN